MPVSRQIKCHSGRAKCVNSSRNCVNSRHTLDGRSSPATGDRSDERHVPDNQAQPTVRRAPRDDDCQGSRSSEGGNCDVRRTPFTSPRQARRVNRRKEGSCPGGRRPLGVGPPFTSGLKGRTCSPGQLVRFTASCSDRRRRRPPSSRTRPRWALRRMRARPALPGGSPAARSSRSLRWPHRDSA